MNPLLLGDENVRSRLAEGLDTGGWHSDRRCLSGTRTRYLARIWEWVRSDEGPAVCWLSGVAGSGKSSISHELAATLHAKRRPYSSFFFRHDDGSLALSAVRLLAYGLSFVSGLRELVVEAMEQSNDTRVNPTMEEQFATLLVAPLQEFAAISPMTTVVLVVDGIDECPADIRTSFLAAIRSGAPLLPSTAKIFLTSRPRDDVRGYLEALESLKIPVAIGVGKDDGDVERFLQHELERISKAAGLEHTWLTSEIKRDAGALAARAGGLFQWARLLSSLLDNRDRPREVVSRVLGGVETSATPEVNLDELYTEALNIALPAAADDRGLEALYRRVVGTVLATQQPLTVSAICTLLKAEEDDNTHDATGVIRALLEDLGCLLVLNPISGGAVVVRIAHTSFYDYVSSRDRCPSNWFIDAHEASVRLGSRCFSLMMKSLRRDICRMGSPFTNKDVSSETIYRYIVTGLRYACSHAFAHVAGDSGNIRMLETFLTEKLLEWLEAMSLMRHLDTAVELMQQALAELSQVCVSRRPLIRFLTPYLILDFARDKQNAASASSVEILQDAVRFVGRFGSILDKSAIQVYFSALPFTPHRTTLYRVYSARYRDIPHITYGYSESWPEELCTVRNLGGGDHTPRQLAFSADSSRLGISTPTHVVTASPVTGVQLGKFRLGDPLLASGSGSAAAESPIIALGCRATSLASVTPKLLLRIADNRSLKEVQLTLPQRSRDRSPSPEPKPKLEPPMEVTCAAFDENVNTLCVGCSDGRLQLWKLRRSSWEPERDGFPYSHSSAVVCVAVASEMLTSVSQRELKIGPCGDSRNGDVTRETLTLMPKWLPEARDIRLSFIASSAAAWVCVVSFRFTATDDHSVYVASSTDHGGKKIFGSDSSSYPVHALSSDGSVVTVVCGDLVQRFSTTTHSLLEKRTLSGVDSTRLDRFPVISPDCRLVAVCDGEVVHIRDLAQPPVKRPDSGGPSIKATGVILTKHCYIVKGGKQQWLARVHADGTSEDKVQLGEHEIERFAVSNDGTRLAALSFYQGKTQHGFLEIANLHSRRRHTTTWPVALHDSFTDWEICDMQFSATGKHVGIVFFLSNASYVCACDLESGSLRWKQLPGKMRPLAARSLRGEELIVVRTRDVWKIDLGLASTGGVVRHELYNSDPYTIATFYAKFTETESSGWLLEIASRLWDRPPRYTVWNVSTDTVGVAPEAEEKARGIKPTIAHLEVAQKGSFGHWVLSNVGQRVCCIPEEYCSNWEVKAQSSVCHDRLALVTGSGVLLVVDFRPMTEYLNRVSS